MINAIAHVGLTISDIERSLDFYQNVLGMTFEGRMHMAGPETEALFARKGAEVDVAYVKGNADIDSPTVELIQFTTSEAEKDVCDLHKTSISELCFYVPDIDALYEHLIKNNVECISAPQFFDFTEFGFSKSKAIYFKDPDGIILEAMEVLN